MYTHALPTNIIMRVGDDMDVIRADGWRGVNTALVNERRVNVEVQCNMTLTAPTMMTKRDSVQALYLRDTPSGR